MKTTKERKLIKFEHIRSCAVCKNPFNAKTYGQNRLKITCSLSCRNSLNAKKENKKNRNFGEAKCLTCGKYFTLRAINQKYCNEVCSHKADYERNIETYRKNDRIKVSRNRIGLNIRDETLKNPSKDAKWLWDGIGRWSTKYWPDIQLCLECNTCVYRHAANGVCERCYDMLRPRDLEEVKKWKKVAYERAKANGHKLSAQVSRDWIKKARNKEIPITGKISNLLTNLDNL